MKYSDIKVYESQYEEFDQLSELEKQHADEEFYFELFDGDDDNGFDVCDMLVIVPEDGLSEEEINADPL